MEKSNWQKLVDLGIPLKFGWTGQKKTICPKCSHSRTHKNEACLSVNIDTGVYSCHNNCGFTGGVDFVGKGQKKYVKPVWTNATSLSKSLVQYWASRGISQQTLLSVKMSEGLKWMPQTQREEWTMQWPYIENGEVVNVKFRGQMQSVIKNKETGKDELVWEKLFTAVKDAKLTMWNLDAIKDSEECLCCEGEPDGMSFIEAGYLTVTSVPNGASLTNNNLAYLDNCIDAFENKKKIYLGFDNDEAGRSLTKEFIRRLGAERCWLIDYGDCKDGNQHLVKYGKFSLPMLIAKAKPCEIDGIMEANDVRAEVFDLFENGLPMGETIGIKEIDEHISFLPGQFTIVGGIPSHGKSNVLDFILERLSVLRGWKVGYFTPEAMPLKLFCAKLVQKLTGKTFDKKFGYTKRCTLEEIGMAMDFIQEHFFFVSIKKKTDVPNDYKSDYSLPNYSLDNILSLAKKMVTRYGINALVIDPWNKLTHLKTKNFNETDDILEKLNEMVYFSETNNVHTFLVAHPTKMKKDKTGKYEVPTLYDISGSAHFYNVAYNGFTVYRDFDTNLSTIYVQKIKLNWLGKVGAIPFTYDHISGRINVVGCVKDEGNHLLHKPLDQGYNEPANVMAAPPIIVGDGNANSDDLPF